jgi:hypothetical protein
MKTIGMMGVVVGRAAALATIHNCSPRDIYENHLDEVKRLWRMEGGRRFENLDALKTHLDANPDTSTPSN